MRFGVTIPNNWGIADPRQVLAMGPLAEAFGYDGSSLPPRRRYWKRPVISAKRVGEQTGEFE